MGPKPSFLSNPAPELAAEGLLHPLFEDAAARHPGRTAVECRGESLSYRDLDARANQFARGLRARGIEKGARVAINLPKSLDLYAAILGTLKAGAAYVPLDPSYPEDRLGFITADCKAALLATNLDFLGPASRLPLPKLYVNEARNELAAHSVWPLPPSAAPSDEAYVIYTSGSTGRPKGVPATHASARHLVLAEQTLYQVREDDRVLQGFSTAFDASVEEIWAAFNAGAALVAGTPEVMHSGPDLGANLERLRISVLSTVPTLLPVIAPPPASVRLLILGGEALRAELLEGWFSPGRRVYNTYGPTETTVVATASLCRPGRPVTIGRPLPNYTAYVLDPGGNVVPEGAEGELAVGGPGVARGYIDRDELTRRSFVPNRHGGLTGDRSPVLYRTGDLARVGSDGDLEYLGRLDTQVKIRGFRVEPSEVESLLLQTTGVRDAAVLVVGTGSARSLAAFVVLRPGAALDEPAVLSSLKAALPPYMVPASVEALPAFPTLPSGKVDRAAFPPPKKAAAGGAWTGEGSPLERLLHAKWTLLFDNPAIALADDFFSDLGGHSLLAAQFVSDMRREPRFAGLAMGDLYADPTIAGLAARLEARGAAAPPPARGGFQPVPRWRHFLSGCVQAAMLYAVVGFFALQWLAPFMAYSFLMAYERDFGEALAGSFLCLCLVYPAMLLLGAACKWVVIGRLKEGDYPLWGAYYLRWLFVQRILSVVPLHFLAGTPLLGAYLRLLGSKIGADVYLDSALVSGLDLLEIGDGASINAEASVSCHGVEGGLLKLRRVRLGKSVSVGIRSVVGQDVVIGEGAALGDLSCAAAGSRLGAGEFWSGSPALRRAPKPEAAARPSAQPPRPWFDALAAGFYTAGFFVLPALALLPVFPGIGLMYHLDYHTEDYSYLLLSPFIALSFITLSALQILALKWAVLGRLEEGVYRIKSLFYMRKWLVDKLMETSLDTLRPLYATLYLNPWLRALGVTLGERAEVSTAALILPDLLEIGEGSFIADGAGLGPAKVVGRNLILERTRIGARTFIGNGACVPVGSRVGDNCLLGCQTLPPGPDTAAGTSWVGTPAVFLPARQKAVKQFASERTYHPTRRLYAQRLVIEFFRVILPATAFIVFTTLMLSATIQLEDERGPLVALLCVPLVYIALGAAAMLVTALLKALVVGRYRPDEQPLWSTFVWRTELVTAFCEDFTAEFFVNHLQGTVFLPWYFRLLGMRIGRRACLLTTDFTEFDLVRLGDDAALNEDCTIQTHLFEDRVMKVDAVDIGARVSVGSQTVVLYGTVVEDDAAVGDLSLLMKGERLYRGTRWAGSPVRPMLS